MAVLKFEKPAAVIPGWADAIAAIKRPNFGWMMLEPMRCMSEIGALMMCYPLLSAIPRGDGHPVMVLPGFATNDQMTVLLRQFLALAGYKVHTWDLGWNLDQHSAGENGEHMAARIERIAQSCGQDVSLVGWSLGGVIAREAARRDHSGLRQVITLGSPFTGNPKATSLTALYEMMTGNFHDSPAAQTRYERGHLPLPVPSSSIYSKTDGVTAWENCVTETDAITENIEVHCSHFGFVANPAVFWAIADRLALPQDEWHKFNRAGPFQAFFPA